jgi:endonuclease/exonuclease/phosphatase family metal-dependent hydrolase
MSSLAGGLHLDVVTLNIRHGIEIERARQLFARHPALARANVVLLQEMDAEGTGVLAAAFGMHYAYHPAFVHPDTGRAFGNAVLSRWPIAGDRVVILPGFSPGSPVRRSATYATVTSPLGAVEVCSLHLATPFQLSRGVRRAQVLEAVRSLRDVERVILGGDFNSHRMAGIAAAASLDWPTRRVGATVARLFSVDHLLTRGFRTHQVGRITDTRDTTDHAAVWARLF